MDLLVHQWCALPRTRLSSRVYPPGAKLCRRPGSAPKPTSTVVTHEHPPRASDPKAPIPVVSFLAGSRRGDTLRLGGDELTIGSDQAADIVLPPDTEPLPLPHHATLRRRGQTYEVLAKPGGGVWVNGESVEQLVLASGDVLEIGRDGAVLRFRLYDADAAPYKSLPEVFSDCLECAQAEDGMVRKATTLARVVPRELATQTTRRFRIATVVAVTGVAVATGFVARRNADLEARLLGQVERIDGLSAFIPTEEGSAVSAGEMDDLLERLRSTADRVEALEAITTANARVISNATPAIVFIQGSYRFVEPETRRPLRTVLGSSGQPLRNPLGHPALSLEGDGPPLEIFLTGTGFIVSADGLAVTNRHVALPWEFDQAAEGVIAAGFEPMWHRVQAFIGGDPAPHPVDVVRTSDDADLAVVLIGEVDDTLPFLALTDEAPRAGDGVIVMGYPLGLRALLARTDADLVERLRAEGITDFYEQAERIATAGFMQPLASRGIVGQVTEARVVYDAETTSGGSGGPVLDLEGRVVAINTAILPEFGGSNLGVPSAKALELLPR